MPIIPAEFQWNPRATAPFALLTCACAFFAGGCFTARRPAPKLTYASLHPIIPSPVVVALADVPEIPAEPEARVAPLVVPRGTPARPRVATVPTPERPVAEKPADPLMAPSLTEEQTAAAKMSTQKSLAAAEGNLSSAKGKALNSAQQDLVSKIQGFVDSAREAMKSNDWPRAQIQAHKAEVLSQEIFPNP